MRRKITAMVLAVGLAVGSSGGAMGAATHATRGVVTSIDASTLVIVRPGKIGGITFNLSASTRREGMIGVGSTVSVRYWEDGKKHIATAIALQRTRD